MYGRAVLRLPATGARTQGFVVRYIQIQVPKFRDLELVQTKYEMGISFNNSCLI